MTPELDWLKKWSTYSPDAVALQSGETGTSWTFQTLYKVEQRLSRTLHARYQIQPGDRVAALAQNDLGYVALFFALQRLGAILVPVNFRFTAKESEFILRDSGAKVLIAQKLFRPLTEALSFTIEIVDFDELFTTPEKEFSENSHAGDFEKPCMILYPSGTTGFPKGAMISPRMIFWNSINTGLRLNLTEKDVVLSFLPLFHTGGWNVLTLPCLHRGARVILLKKFDPDLILQLIEKEAVSVLFGVPTTMDLLRRSPLFAGAKMEHLRYAIVGGEPMPVDLIRVWEERGVPIRQGYGLTEFGPNVFSLDEKDSLRKIGSIGFPNFYTEARVLDERGNEVPANVIGELALRGPVAMNGYWNNRQATEEVFRDGWLLTGDLVRRDEDGFYYVVGRKKEMFISGGENVYPAEIERVLRQCPGVREAAVIGRPHAKWGECGQAFVAGESLNCEILTAFCQTHLAKFKVPTEFVVLSELPKTESGKIAKAKLASDHIARV